MGKEKKPNGCTGFRIGIFVRKIEIAGKTFIFRSGSNTARHVELRIDHVTPEPFSGFQQTRVPGGHTQIGYRRQQIHGSYRMADHFRLLSNRYVSLHVGIR